MRVSVLPYLPGGVTPPRLDDYAALFRADFRRRDQARWAAIYLRGLLLDGERKNVEAIARRAAPPSDLPVEDPTQALQNFINQSPWDERKLLRRYRAIVARVAGPGGHFVVADVAFPKQGNRSVGVQRQYSREHGKINCQVAVTLHYVTESRPWPLGVRLYLPRGWVQSPDRLDAAGVPRDCRGPAARADLALALIDEALAAGLAPAAVVPGEGYDDSEPFRAGLAPRGLPEAAAERWGAARRTAEEVCRRMKEELGLDHFEGRSWRGFHHHAALVILAYAFRCGAEQDFLEAGAGI